MGVNKQKAVETSNNSLLEMNCGVSKVFVFDRHNFSPALQLGLGWVLG